MAKVAQKNTQTKKIEENTKQTTNKEVEVKAVETNSTQTTNNIDNTAIMAMLQQLQQQLNEQQAQLKEKDTLIQSLQKNNEKEKNDKSYVPKGRIIEKGATSEIKIGNDEEIVVTSLWDGELVLSTEGFGIGTKYRFRTFGYEMEIPYDDLKKIIHSNRSFIESGRVFINDERVIKKHRLQDFYTNMLNVEDFENIDKMNVRDFERMLFALPKAESDDINRGNEPNQIDLVLNYILVKMRDGKEFPFDLIQKLDEVYAEIKGIKLNLVENIQTNKEIEEQERQERKGV